MTETGPGALADHPDFTPDRGRLRRLRLRRAVVQGGIVMLAACLVVALVLAVRASFQARGIAFSYGFLTQPAGFQISEGVVPGLSGGPGLRPFTPSMSNAQALLAAVINTMKVAVLAIILATVIGAAIGVGRLSTNWLIRQICFHLVEFTRNTPLLIQLTFWYTVVFLGLPGLVSAFVLPGGIVVSRNGTWLPWLQMSETAPAWALPAMLVGAALLVAAAFMRRRVLLMAGLALVLGALLGGLLVLDRPQVGRFNASGGMKISSEFAALLVALTLNSAAYIGEIVRGAIDAMPKGQWEASAALGLSRRQTLFDIILPQVFRIVLPAFGNQYIGLAKNTSLGIAIGFPDLFNVFGTVANQTGRMLEGIGIAIALYLAISLLISGLVNALNRRFARQGRRA